MTFVTVFVVAVVSPAWFSQAVSVASHQVEQGVRGDEARHGDGHGRDAERHDGDQGGR